MIVFKFYKSLLFILFALLSDLYHSQTTLELAVIKELNLYRKKHGLVALTYDAKSSEMARYHAIYLKTMNELGYSSLDYSSEQQHDEGIDLPDFKEMTFEERARQVLPIRWVSEILIQCSLKRKNDQETGKAICISEFAYIYSSPDINSATVSYYTTNDTILYYYNNDVNGFLDIYQEGEDGSKNFVGYGLVSDYGSFEASNFSLSLP